MAEIITVLIVEDSEDDAQLTLLALRRGGLKPTWERVETADALQAALDQRSWDVVISDYRLPQFDAPQALAIVQQHQMDCPFIVVSGTMGEESAVAMMKAGAHDYLMKDNLTRLPEAVRREIREAQIRSERRITDERLRLTAEREQLVHVVTERIRRSLDLDEILMTTVNEVRQVLHSDRVIFFKLVSNEDGYVVQESVGENCDPLLGRDIYDPCFHQGYVEKYAQGRTWAIADLDDGKIQTCPADFLRQFQIRANLIVPVIQSDTLWGLLIAHHCTAPRQWTDEEIRLMKQIADQTAIAIQQASLLRQTQLELAERQRAEAALQQLNQELEQRVQERTETLQHQVKQENLLRLIIQTIHQSLHIDGILTTVLDETRHMLYADRVAIYQFHPDWSGKFLAESVADGWESLVGDEIQRVWVDTYLQETQGGRYRNNETFAVNDIHTVGYDPCHVDLLEQFQARAYAIAPIILDDQLWGLLAMYQNSGPRQWQDWEISLLQQIGIQLAIALRQSRLYQAAQEQVRELEKLHQLKDDFLSTISHELRSPLANIKMAIQMLDLGLHQQQITDERLIHYLHILNRECEQEMALVNDLLDLQRLEAGVQPLDLRRLDLSDWLPSVAEPFIDRAQEQSQQFTLDIPPTLPSITTDVNSLKRVIIELLHNACKYTPPGESIILKTWATDTQLHIQVSNSGVELPSDELPHVFDKFYRITSVDRWKHGGTGLGLALVKRLIEHLDGSIKAKSANKITCFTVRLPCG
ncbi:MAG: GAF domain-containing protein [Leptolyngbyaceae bacterium]|nr:GAF domain-containing protein [Leptolyngbyaceae bacterium]